MIRYLDLWNSPGADMVLAWARSAASPAAVFHDYYRCAWCIL